MRASHAPLLAALFLCGQQLIGDSGVTLYDVTETSVRQAFVHDRALGRVAASEFSRMLLVVNEEWKQLKQTMCQIRGDVCKEQDLGEVGGQAWAAKTHFKVVVRRDKHSFRVRT